MYTGVINLMNTTYSPDTIIVRWDAANSPYCGGVLYYIVMISSDGCSSTIDGIMGLTATFSNLRNDTNYNIRVTAVNTAGAGMMELINVKTSSSPVLPQCNDTDIIMDATNNQGTYVIFYIIIGLYSN